MELDLLIKQNTPRVCLPRHHTKKFPTEAFNAKFRDVKLFPGSLIVSPSQGVCVLGYMMSLEKLHQFAVAVEKKLASHVRQ